MKAMVLTGIRAMEMRDVAAPELRKSTDVLIRMHTIGVCGSDVHYYETGRIGSQVVSYPYRVGHECSGYVAALGDAVDKVAVGDLVAVDPAISCWKCDQCRAGRPHTCRNLGFLGTPGQADGCLCERIVMPAESCFRANGLSPEQAALVEPLSIGVYAVKQSGGLAGNSIAILGAGPIGNCVLLSARTRGVGRTFVTDKLDYRLDFSRTLGAEWTGNPQRLDIVHGILCEVPSGLDIVFECCGDQEALDQAVDLLKPGGKLVIVGIPRADRVSFSIDKLRRKEICVHNIRRQVDCVQAALDLIAGGSIDISSLSTHRFGFARAQQAFDLVGGYHDDVIKAMIEL
ncbi:MAG: alcohol dehydrogenase catalytic domain-containing protein [Chitinivibrionales bacterium]|nr:alcohol dehydrogenase catalytic domain-containing protein [Chitinivibrionales bacterium]